MHACGMHERSQSPGASRCAVQIAGNRVAVCVAEPKTRQGSVTPTEGRPFSRRGSASGHAQLSPCERLDCNPTFWAWVSSQGVPALDSVEAVQKWHVLWQQEGCPAPQSGGSNQLASHSGPATMNSSAHSAASIHGQLADENVRILLACLLATAGSSRA
jgi:hypothetical protein